MYKVIVSQKKVDNHWNESFLKWIPSRFMLTSTWKISILPAHLLRAQTWGNLDFRVGLNENENSFFATRCRFWSVKSSQNTALNEIDQSPQISVTQKRDVEKLIVERIVWESLSK